MLTTRWHAAEWRLQCKRDNVVWCDSKHLHSSSNLIGSELINETSINLQNKRDFLQSTYYTIYKVYYKAKNWSYKTCFLLTKYARWARKRKKVAPCSIACTIDTSDALYETQKQKNRKRDNRNEEVSSRASRAWKKLRIYNKMWEKLLCFALVLWRWYADARTKTGGDEAEAEGEKHNKNDDDATTETGHNTANRKPKPQKLTYR